MTPASAKQPGLAAAARALGIRAAQFKAEFAGLDEQDRLDLTDSAYKVPVTRQAAARERCARGRYAALGGANLMGVQLA